MRGRVTKSTGTLNMVRTEAGDLVQSKLKGNFRVKGIKSTNPVAVGDWVKIEIQPDGIAYIVAVEERHNSIVRKSINLSKKAHILASNIDQVLIFVTLRDPETSMGFVDRLICNAEAYHINPILVFNKIDLLSTKNQEDLLIWKYTYEKLGYQCLEMSLVNEHGIEAVKEAMKGKTSMLAGHSGTGKSSMINALDSNKKLKIGAISDYHRQGKHTTTFAEMHHLSFGADIIDTPGIRGFGIIDMNKKELSHYFIEMRRLLPNCKFNNCQHINEPHCAVKEGLENLSVMESRYKSYLSIYFEEEEQTYRGVDY
ncbi:MAG: ribosome small subunit-dependent GTPase A [Flavobacteriales bacterium]|nr:ribosome small subunit-dependent GTPase A [Flavobacteriales bacterium]